MRKNKKASMELSVNAIVVLVIAIVIMGLILGFIRSKFNQIGDDLQTKEPDAPPASASAPITFSTDMKVITAGESAIVKVNVYNGGTAIANNNRLAAAVTCTPAAGAGLVITTSSAQRTINVGEQQSYTISIAAARTTPKNTHICTITNSVVALGSADLTIKVV
jgi:hypothetical protein